MTHCVEPFIRDIVWLWLENHDEYEQVGCEVGIGEGVNSGRIDLVAITTEGEYHGFEIKNDTFADEQLNRYVRSEYLDKIFHCSRKGEKIAEHLENDAVAGNGAYQGQQIRKEVGNAIAAGQYTEQDYREALREALSDTVMRLTVDGASSVNNRVLDEESKKIETRLTKNIGIPTADFEAESEYIGLHEAIQQIKNYLIPPDVAGVLHVPLRMETKSFDDERDYDGFRMYLQFSVDRAFSKSKLADVEIVRDGHQFTREYAPVLSTENEAWVQHHLWRTHGTIREAIIPSASNDSEYRIDVMGFEGASTAPGVYQDQYSRDLIGIEAKEKGSITGTNAADSVRSQLQRYLDTKTLTRLFLGVPESGTEEAYHVLDPPQFEKVGILSVDELGAVTLESPATKLEMEFDAYEIDTGKYQYPRSIGYGKVAPPDEPDPVNPCVLSKT